MNLKPCPFCNGSAVLERLGTNRVSCIILCEDCGCRLESNETDQWCGEAWNHRPDNDLLNERLVDRTTGMLDSLAKPRLSAASFRAGWEASMDFASGGTSNLEQALQQHLDTKTTDL